MQDDKEDRENNSEQEPLMSLSDARFLLDMVCIINALLRNKGNISRAAEELGIGRRTIYDLMDKYGISWDKDMLCIKFTPLMQCLEIESPYIKRYLS